MGDAAHTAHFSIGSGTKLAMEDAIELANSIAAHPHDLDGALKHYSDVRSVEVLRIQNAARNSMEWFENVQRYAVVRAGAVRVFAADAQPAHQRTRTCACATPRIWRTSRTGSRNARAST